MPVRLTFFLTVFCTQLVFAFQQDLSTSDFVGANACIECHAEQAKQWQKSDHFRAMEEPNESTVLGDFSGITLTFHNIENRFYQKDGEYFIETIGHKRDNDKDGKPQKKSFKVLYTFGYYPLQQYLVSIGDGHLQAMNVTWDSRPKEQGGQRWYHLQPDEKMDQDNPFYWAGHFQNWNSRCADCHSTNLQKNYSTEDASYATSWSDINVACEACHGPGKKHLELAAADKLSKNNSGLAYVSPQKMQWAFEQGSAVAQAHGQPNDAHINMCGGCHSRRLQVDDPNKIADYHQKYRLQTLAEGLYFADGQIQDEVYVMGSFVQSKMAHAGVTCMNCHDPHTAKLIGEPNQVCAQCHKADTYETEKHMMHKSNSAGGECVDCHMPERTYMGVDPRRDHSFTIPNPELSIKTGVPNACTGCHSDKDNQWAAAALKANGSKPPAYHWAELNHSARNMDLLAVRPLSVAVSDATIAPLVRASLMEGLTSLPSRVSVETAQTNLSSDDPLVRRAAVGTLAIADPQTRWQSLYPLFNDPVRSVRFEVASVLLEIYQQLPPASQKKLVPMIDEYKASLAITADFPSGQLSLANLALNMGEADKAEAAYKKAIAIAPAYVPALLNLADFYRARNLPDQELPLLQAAIAAVPESAAVQHATGLFHIRQKAYQKALPFLRAATGDSPDSSPRFNFVYAVALDTVGQTKEAIRVLQKSDKRWPNQYETLATLISYLEKTGNESAVYPYLSKLSRIAPNSPQVKMLIQKYR